MNRGRGISAKHVKEKQRAKDQSSSSAECIVEKYESVVRVHLPRKNNHVEGARSEPRSRKLPQSDAGGSRDRTTAKESVVSRRKSIANNRQDKSMASSRQDKSMASSRQDKSIEDLEEDWKDSKSDTAKEPIANSKVETKPRSEPKATTKPTAEPTAETKAKAKADAKAKSTPELFRVEDKTGGDWKVSNRVGSWRQNEERKMMEADVRDVSQATTVAVALQNTVAVGSTPASSLQRRSSRNLKRRRQRIKLKMTSRITSMKQRSCKINEQGSDGEEVSQRNRIKRTLSRRGHAKPQEAQQNTHQIQATEEQRVHDNGVDMVTTKQYGDDKSCESTEVSAWKTNESRNEVQKVSEKDTFPESPAEGVRRTESETQRATNEQSQVAEVTEIETSKINHEVVNDTRSETSESQQKVQPRSSAEDTS